MANEQKLAKLIAQLKELFQLDQPDLDFGFYRIMHAKANQVFVRSKPIVRSICRVSTTRSSFFRRQRDKIKDTINVQTEISVQISISVANINLRRDRN